MNKRIAVLVSGTGSLLEAMIADKLPIALVLADRPCRGIDVVAAEAKLPRVRVLREDFSPSFDRAKYTREVVKVLHEYNIDLVVMAGFMTIFSRVMFDDYNRRILNIHPSLLPLFKGDHAVRDALAARAEKTGTTVHVATPELDAGPILAQEPVMILPGDTENSLHERIKAVERQLYPAVIREYAAELG